jgi:hypothetical protein
MRREAGRDRGTVQRKGDITIHIYMRKTMHDKREKKQRQKSW